MPAPVADKQGKRASGKATAAGLPPPSGSGTPSLMGATLRDTYTIDGQIGEGGMSQIYEAHHARLGGRRFAIKILRARLARSPSIRERFQREIRAVASISHPAVVGVFDYGTTAQDWPYMVTEFYDGLDIRACLEKYGRLNMAAVLEIGRVLAEALVATHAQGVIHRDLKPSNVFLVGNFNGDFPDTPEVKLLDFGLSRFLEADTRTTASGLILGTPSYMAPEQAHGQGGDELSDVYGLGAVLYAAITGEAPFAGDTIKETLLMVMTRKPVRPGKLCPNISEGLEVVIQRAMAREPRDRYASMGEMVFALSNLQGRPTSVEGKARAVALVAPPTRLPVRLRFSGWVVIAAVIALALVGTSLWGNAQVKTGALRSTVQLALLALSSLVGIVWGLRANFRSGRGGAWTDTALLDSWVPQIRRLLGAGLIAYAGASLAVTSAAELLPIALPPLFPRLWEQLTATSQVSLRGLAWPGWQPILTQVALIWMGVAALGEKRRPRQVRRKRAAPLWSVVLLLFAATLCSLSLLGAGWTWPAEHIFVSPGGSQH